MSIGRGRTGACLGALAMSAALPAAAALVTIPPGATVALAGTSTFACADVSIQGAVAVGASQANAAGDLTIAPGATLDGGSGTVGVGGSWTNLGTFIPGTGTVAFGDGCKTTPAQVGGATTFANLTFGSTAGRTFVIPAGSVIAVTGVVTLAGAPGVLIQVVSSSGQPANVVLLPGGSLSSTHAQIAANVTIGNPVRLANISTRMQVLTGNDVLIGGFVIGGVGSKTVVVRARGPSLVPFGISNALVDPQLTLVRSSDQQALGANDNWLDAPNAAAITASGFAPAYSLESALLATLAPGAYTAIVSGAGSGTGVGIVEVFEVDGAHIPLVNISTRGQVLAGHDVMIGGFIIQGDAPRSVVVRARGPSLVPFGIPNALANPQLRLVRSADQTTIASNDDWQSAANAADITASGFAPSDALESALLMTLQPGAYTAIVTGAGGGTGVGIVEVFAQ